MPVGRILAGLPRTDAATVVRDGSRTVVAFGAVDALVAPPTPFAALDALTAGWWAGYCAYELGHAVERVRPRPVVDAGGGPGARDPDLALVRFAARAVIAPDGTVELTGAGAERRALERALAEPTVVIGADPEPAVWRSSLDRCDYESRVLAVQELIRAGECYQVNLTRRLDGPPTDPVALWTSVARGNPAPHAMFWSPGGAAPGAPTVVSASPERFLRVDDRSVETQPIKGTAADANRLRTSEKDRAENVMIVDLARNDLGRVCTPGSVTVPELCRVEPHPGLVHLVSTVRGARRDDVGFGALLRATFPPASITGAPKPRVMQAIEDLEPVPRGVYCGATGWFDADRDTADLAVAIRTFSCRSDGTGFGVGAGITIDSEPAAEWDETELKAARLLALAGARTDRALAAVTAP
jgi:para-aminobenzoate synthetase component 1